MRTTTLLALGLVFTACNKDDSADSGLTSDTGATSRIFVEPMRVAATPKPVFTESGDELAVLTISTDTGGDGVIDRVVQWSYDDRGNRVLLEEDMDGDGTFEKVTANEYVYGDNNRVILVESDEGLDGTIDAVEMRTYNDRGRVLEVVHDLDNDGKPDKIETNVWNDRGLRVRWQTDQPVGGPIETVQEWDFDDEGRSHSRTMHRQVGDSLTSYRYNNVFDANGRLHAFEVDNGADGSIDNRGVRFYDMSGRMVETQNDIDNDGTPDNSTVYGYDGQGKLRTISIDNGMDGVSNTVIYRDYSNFKEKDDCRTK